jgi:hypothetical protein
VHAQVIRSEHCVGIDQAVPRREDELLAGAVVALGIGARGAE